MPVYVWLFTPVWWSNPNTQDNSRVTRRSRIKWLRLFGNVLVTGVEVCRAVMRGVFSLRAIVGYRMRCPRAPHSCAAAQQHMDWPKNRQAHLRDTLVDQSAHFHFGEQRPAVGTHSLFASTQPGRVPFAWSAILAVRDEKHLKNVLFFSPPQSSPLPLPAHTLPPVLTPLPTGIIWRLATFAWSQPCDLHSCHHLYNHYLNYISIHNFGILTLELSAGLVPTSVISRLVDWGGVTRDAWYKHLSWLPWRVWPQNVGSRSSKSATMTRKRTKASKMKRVGLARMCKREARLDSNTNPTTRLVLPKLWRNRRRKSTNPKAVPRYEFCAAFFF